MGISRAENDRLLRLAEGARVHVRVDAGGTPLVDDQTIQENPNASTTRQTIQSKRTYLCDASFAVVVVPGPATSTQEIAAAAREPKFAPFLGRRACVLSTPLLVSPEVSGTDALALFDSIERGPAELIELLSPATPDFYLDVDSYPGALRRIPIRDDFAGPLPRQWRERFAVHVRKPFTPSLAEG